MRRLYVSFAIIAAFLLVPNGAWASSAKSAGSKLVRPAVVVSSVTSQVASSGGAIKLLARVHDGTKCAFSATPSIAGFGGTVRCGTGVVTRTGRIPANSTPTSRIYLLKVIVKGANGNVTKHAVVSEVASQPVASKPGATTASTSSDAASSAASTSLATQIDPTFTQNPTNPLEVTYMFSASQTITSDGVTTPVSPLPQGVLEFFSDGLLACSINVGGSVDGGTCTITYASLGNHTVVTIYDSGTNSATETEVEDIQPVVVNLTPVITDVEAVYEPPGTTWLTPQERSMGVLMLAILDVVSPDGVPTLDFAITAILNNPEVGTFDYTSNGDDPWPAWVPTQPGNSDLSYTINVAAGSQTIGGFEYVWGDFSQTVTLVSQTFVSIYGFPTAIASWSWSS